MSTVLLDSEPCCDPGRVYADCVRQRLSVEWFGKPNSWSNPRGIQSGQGWALLTRASLDNLDLTKEQALTFSLDPTEIAGLTVKQAQTVVQKALNVVKATCITAGLRGDPACCYLIELADRRRLARLLPINSAYNVISSAGDYGSATLNSGVPWTWALMLADVWSNLTAALGTNPGLPFTPDGTPEGFDFYGSSPAIDALGAILDRLCCALVMDLAGKFKIVQLGLADKAAAAALLTRDTIRVWDEDPVLPAFGRVPATVRVQFPVQNGAVDPTGASPWYTIDQTDDNPLPGADGVVVLNDDLAAVNAGGTIVNLIEVTSRAEERAENYFLALHASPLRRYYGLPLADGGLLPGSLISSVRVGDRGRGMVTEVQNDPAPPDSPRPFLPGDTSCCMELVRILCVTSGTYGWPGLVQLYDSGTQTYSDLDGRTTTIGLSITMGVHTVTPASMSGLAVGDVVLFVDGLCTSYAITITATNATPTVPATTFTANFPAGATAYGILGVTGISGGSGYASTPPPVTFGGSGSGATGTAILDPTGDFVIGVLMLTNGGNYNPTATVTFGAPGSGVTATGTATVSGPITIYLAGVWVPFLPGPADFLPVANDVAEPVIFRASREMDSPDGLRVRLADGGITADWSCPDGKTVTTYTGRAVKTSG